MKIHEWAAQWLDGLTVVVIDAAAAEKFIIEAANEYHAWGALLALSEESNPRIDRDTALTVSEWGVIKPLAELLAERESALMQESSRLVGLEQFGRSSGEIAQDIANYRHEYLRRWAFSQMPTTI